MGKRLLRTACSFAAFVAASPPATAKDTRLSRGVYWQVPAAARPDNISRTEYLQKNGISEVHIWLNDNEWDNDHSGLRCQPFSYTDSKGSPLWTRESLLEFVNELRQARIEIIFTFSPQAQTKEYIKSLSGPEGPLTIARQLSVPVELDIEPGNWPDDRRHFPCRTESAAEATTALVNEIHSSSHPLKLIVSTTSWATQRNPVVTALFLKNADAISPQLYDKWFNLTPTEIELEITSIWSKWKHPMIAALSLGCRHEDGVACSRSIFEKGLEYIATQSLCGRGAQITSYAIWSVGSGLHGSNFGAKYLLDTANKDIPTSCE